MLDEPAANIVRKGRLQPGKLFLVDLEEGRIVADEEVKHEVATAAALRRLVRARASSTSPTCPTRAPRVPRTEPLRNAPARVRLHAGGPARPARADRGAAPRSRSARWATTSRSRSSPTSRPPLFAYFKQLFAQVTNPPIDPIRESRGHVRSPPASAPRRNLLDETPEHAHQLSMRQPILRNAELEKLRQVDHDVFEAHTLDITWPVEEGPDGLAARARPHLRARRRSRSRAASTSSSSPTAPSAPSACRSRRCSRSPRVHHHLVREGTRLQAGLVVESGEPREVHHFATLIGYGASAINPYLVFESLDELVADGRLPDGIDAPTRPSRTSSRRIGKGLLKTISKMGISTIQSYCGAQIFEAVGLERELVDQHFTGTASRIGGIGLDVLAREALDRHARAYPRDARATCCRSAASTRGAATASTTCGTRRRSRCSSTRSRHGGARDATTSTRG